MVLKIYSLEIFGMHGFIRIGKMGVDGGSRYKGKLKKFQDEKTEPPKQSLLILCFGENSSE